MRIILQSFEISLIKRGYTPYFSHHPSNARQPGRLAAALYREQEHNKQQTQRSTFTTPGQPGRLINYKWLMESGSVPTVTVFL